MRDDETLLASPSVHRFYDFEAPLDKALPEAIAEHGLKRQPGDLLRPEAVPSIVPGLLRDLGLGPADYAAALASARRNGTDVGRELVASKHLSQERLASAMARALGISDAPLTHDDRIVGEADDGALPAHGTRRRLIRTCDSRLSTKIAMAPRLEDLDETGRILAAHPERRWHASIVAPRAIAAHRAAASAARRAEAARISLSRDRPDLSARNVLTGLQGMVVAAFMLVLAATGIARPGLFLAMIHLVGFPLFFACVLARLAAAATPPAKPSKPISLAAQTALAAPRPVYTVLVALHREKDMAADLVAAIAALEWPRSKLEVMLICEGDDAETIAAVEAAIAEEPGFEIVLVPPSLPRTKPKALNFALPLATGEFVVLYDAEDRPRPDQLEAAFAGFLEGGERLACLQAPLVVRNGADNWFAGHFALEYAALFRGFLPWLARFGLPLPLGGTSNHFRRDALVAVGAWDSHNVTEDADLGIRLCRAGHRIATIEAPTYEDAPERWADWRNQRTRWMKGWMQTWLVHMRHPYRLWRDLGTRGFLAFHVLFFGMIASALAHPFFLIFLAATVWSIASGGPLDAVTRIVVAADLFNLVFGYLAFAVLAVAPLDAEERRVLPRRLWSLYVYWLMISFAALRAVLQLMTAPHIWEKTPHGPAARADALRELGATERLRA